MNNITPRQLSILNEIIKQYISTGEPVGSKLISEKIGVSSATVRNEMTILTERQYLFQPHTSSGRAPSLNAFRLYIDRLVNPTSSTWQISRISQLMGKDFKEADILLSEAMATLSEVLFCPVILSININAHTKIKDIKVIVINPNTVLLCVVLSKVYIKSQVCKLPLNLNIDKIEYINDIFNKHIVGLSLSDINITLIQSICAENSAIIFTISPLLETLFEITADVLSDHYYLEGEHRLFLYTNSNLDTTRELMMIMSQKAIITQLMQKNLANTTVLFGDDIAPQLNSTSVILAKFNAYSASGTVGVLGPLQLDYEHIMPSIDYFSKNLAEKIQQMWD